MVGQTVTLYERTQTGETALGEPIYTETPVEVKDVLIGEPSTDDVASSTSIYARRIDFMLGIPKGDTHDWENKRVSWVDAYGRTLEVETFGIPITGIEANIPTRWHMKVRCERYEPKSSSV